MTDIWSVQEVVSFVFDGTQTLGTEVKDKCLGKGPKGWHIPGSAENLSPAVALLSDDNKPVRICLGLLSKKYRVGLQRWVPDTSGLRE